MLLLRKAPVELTREQAIVIYANALSKIQFQVNQYKCVKYGDKFDATQSQELHLICKSLFDARLLTIGEFTQIQDEYDKFMN